MSSGINSANGRKRARVEDDDDFSTRKSRRRSSTNQIALDNNNRRTSRFQEISSDSDAPEDLIMPDLSPVQKAPKPRRLPAYLARKDDGSNLEIPKELSSDIRPRSAKRKNDLVNGLRKFASANTARKEANGSTHLQNLAKQAEANRKAKLRALRGDDASDGDSQSDVSEEKAPQISKPKNITRRLAKKVESIPSSILGKSIFSKPGPKKKIKIVSAHTAKQSKVAAK